MALKDKLLAIAVVISVFLAGCTSQPKTETKAAVDTTEQSIADAGNVDSDLNDAEVKDVSSDLDQVIDTLS